MDFVQDFESFLNEARVTVKRKYTEAHPEKRVSDHAPVRERILNYVKEKKEVSQKQLLEFIRGLNEETGGGTSRKWVNKYSQYFNVKERNNTKYYSLSKAGERVREAAAKNKSNRVNESA